MEIVDNTQEVMTENELRTKEYITNFLALKLEIKQINEDIKEIKKEAKLDGVDVQLCNKLINSYLKQLKEKPGNAHEEAMIEKVLKTDNIAISMNQLVSK